MPGREIAGPDDIRAIQALASRLWPMGWHPGGLGWALARNRLAEEVVVFDEGERLAAWAALDQPGQLLAQLDPSCPELAPEIVEWFLEQAAGPELSVEVMDGDGLLAGALERRGFARADEAGPVCGLILPALDRAPSLPGGYAVRSVEPTEASARVEVHRAAWRPASLPWPPEHRPPVEPGATSNFNERAYDAVRQIWLYDPELDLVVVAPDASLGGVLHRLVRSCDRGRRDRAARRRARAPAPGAGRGALLGGGGPGRAPPAGATSSSTPHPTRPIPPRRVPISRPVSRSSTGAAPMFAAARLTLCVGSCDSGPSRNGPVRAPAHALLAHVVPFGGSRRLMRYRSAHCWMQLLAK